MKRARSEMISERVLFMPPYKGAHVFFSFFVCLEAGPRPSYDLLPAERRGLSSPAATAPFAAGKRPWPFPV